MGNVLLNDDSWVYEGNPETSTRDHVRELIQDTDPKRKLVSDASIAYAVLERANVYFAAEKLCLMLAAMFADKPAVSYEGVSEQWPGLVDNYKKLAAEYNKVGAAQANASNAGTSPQAISTSIAALKAWRETTDNNLPVFSIGMLLDPKFDPRL